MFLWSKQVFSSDAPDDQRPATPTAPKFLSSHDNATPGRIGQNDKCITDVLHEHIMLPSWSSHVGNPGNAPSIELSGGTLDTIQL
jgi:hypothetical protein